MADQETASMAASDPEDRFTYEDLLDRIKAPLEYRFSEGPWSGRHLPPMAHRSTTFSIEAISPRVREIDNVACMSSVDHLHRALEWGFPVPEVVAQDPDFTHLDVVLLKDVLAWIEADWDLRRVIHHTPETYERGLDVAAAAGLRRVDRAGPTHPGRWRAHPAASLRSLRVGATADPDEDGGPDG